jgi:hypothetical protein
MFNSDLEKEAQMLENNAVYVAESLYAIIRIMISSMKPESRSKSFDNIKGKLSGFNVMEISNKKSPGGAAIGVSLGLIKNVLNSKDPYFINVVLSELSSRL